MEDKELFYRFIQNYDVNVFLEDLKKYHSGSYEHSLRVCKLSLGLGEDLGLNGFELRTLGYAALLHDIGKLDVSLSLIEKKGKLDDSQRHEMNRHIRKGFLKLSEKEYGLIKKVGVRHHEWKNEMAYPRSQNDRRNIQRDDERRHDNDMINSLSQIIAVCDMYDALTSRRDYKESLPLEKVEQILREQFRGDEIYIEHVMKLWQG